MKFNNVSLRPLGKIVARVDRFTGNLEINENIWPHLPKDYQEFVIFHEDGHLQLSTPDEFAANNYAIDRFLEHSTLTNEDFGKKIVVLSEIMSPAGREKFRDRQYDNLQVDSGSSGAGYGGIVASVFSGIANVANVVTAKDQAKAQSQIIQAESAAAQKKTTNQILIISVASAFIIAGLMVYLMLKK